MDPDKEDKEHAKYLSAWPSSAFAGSLISVLMTQSCHGPMAVDLMILYGDAKGMPPSHVTEPLAEMPSGAKPMPGSLGLCQTRQVHGGGGP